MGRQGPRRKAKRSEDDGFAEWGGYMEAKKSKLLDQFHSTEVQQISNIFEGVAIFINGFTRPPIEELKKLMAAHGGTFHAYQSSKTTHIIASNLPNVKIKQLGSVPIVKPSWITDSIELGKLLDFKRYLLYTNQSVFQPKLQFPVIDKLSSDPCICSHASTTNGNSSSTTNDNTVQISSDITLKNDNIHNLTTDESEHIIDQSKNVESKTNNDESNEIHNNLLIADTSEKHNKHDKHIESKKGDVRSKASTKTASDPNFLNEFYNNSRLHLISTLGAEFKQLIGQMRDKSDGTFPGKQKLIEKGIQSNRIISGTVIMHIDMDCFFVSVGLRNHPELKGKPVAITHARNGQISNIRPDQQANREQEFAMYSERLPIGVTSRVDKLDTHSSLSEIASCSYEARKCGLRNGMFLGQAIKMCPDLKTLPYDFEGYKEVSHILYKTVASYTLDIEAVSCDEMYVDVTKVLRDTGLSVLEWATHIRNEIMEITGCPCSTGFGANRLQARIATRKAKPAGQFYLKPEDVEEFMAEIPLSDLPGVGRSTLAKLMNLGLNTCGDVQVMSLKVLQSEIGQKAGETIKEQAVGIDKKSLNYHHERKSVSAEVNYGIRFKTINECYTFLESLSSEVYKRLHDINMKARCVTLKLLVRAADAPVETAKFLGHGICDALSKSTTNVMINDSNCIFREVKTLYEKLNPPFADLRGLGIQLSKLEKNVPMNNALSNFLKQKPSGQSAEVINRNQNKSAMNKDSNERMVTSNTSHLEKVQEVPSGLSLVAKTKKGRPKGISNKSKTSRDNPPPVNKYFSETKGISSNSKTKKFDIGGKIDLDVLKQLPEDLQKEILEDAKGSISVNPDMKQFDIQSEIDLNVLKELPKELQNEIIKGYQLSHLENQDIASTPTTQLDAGIKTDEVKNASEAKKTPFSKLSWDQMKLMIISWISSSDQPEEVDTMMIANHFKQFAIDRKIELLLIVFNFLHRHFSKLNCSWHKAYFTIVNRVQEGMVARYGLTLMVNRTFKCCQM